MGAQLSVQRSVAQQNAQQGWPAFMTGNAVQKQMSRFRVRRSLLGRRVRFIGRTGECIEYARLSLSRDGVPFYQRVDGPCQAGTAMPKFPFALAADELERRAGVPYKVTVLRENYAEMAEPGSVTRCASYRRASSGIWVKVEEKCRETAHDEEVKRQLATGSGGGGLFGGVLGRGRRRSASASASVEDDDDRRPTTFFSPGTGRRISGGAPTSSRSRGRSRRSLVGASAGVSPRSASVSPRSASAGVSPRSASVSPRGSGRRRGASPV